MDCPRDALAVAAVAENAHEYSTCKGWRKVTEGENLRYSPVIRVSDPGAKDRPAYTGIWFYDGQGAGVLASRTIGIGAQTIPID